jgi:hypothetical protein
MCDSTRNYADIRYLFPVALLLAAIFILVGCSLGEASSAPTPTPTLAGRSVPAIIVVGGSDGKTAGGMLETATAVTAVTILPTASIPDATEQAIAAETAWSEEATETVERANIPQPIETNAATVEPAAVDMDTAWGPTPGVERVPIALDNDSMFVFHSVDPDGRFVLGAIVSRVLESGAPQTTARLVMVDAKDGHFTEIARYVGPAGPDLASDPASFPPLFGSDTDGETVVWNEQSAVRAYSIATGVTRTLVEQAAGQNKPPSTADVSGEPSFSGTPSFRAPRVDHGIAVWQEYAYMQPQSSVAPVRIMKADLATGDIAELNSYGTEAVVSWPYAGWIEYPRSGEGVNKLTLYHKGVITLLNLVTGEKTSLDSISDAATFGLSNDAVIYSRTSGQAFITDLRGTSSRLISGAYFRAYPFISLNERIATWMAYPPVSYDRVQDRRVYLSISGPPLSSVRVVKGHTLAWQTEDTFIEMEGAKPGTILPNDQSVYLVDTDNLPR